MESDTKTPTSRTYYRVAIGLIAVLTVAVAVLAYLVIHMRLDANRPAPAPVATAMTPTPAPVMPVPAPAIPSAPSPGASRQAPGNQAFADPFGTSSGTVPRLDVEDEDSEYVVSVDLPGTKESDVQVNLTDQQLTISGTRNVTTEEKDGDQNVIRRERQTGSFERSLTLADPVRPDGMKTTMSDGVLRIVIPKMTTAGKG